VLKEYIPSIRECEGGGMRREGEKGGINPKPKFKYTSFKQH